DDSVRFALEAPPPLPRSPRRRGLLGQISRTVKGVAKTSVEISKTMVTQTLLTFEDNKHPVEVVKSLGILSATSAAILAKLLILPADRRSVFKGELGAIKRVVWSKPLDLAQIKAIGRAHNATINDVLVAAVAGALRDYMLHVGDDPAKGDINAMVPVNLRPLDKAIDLGNQFALVYLPLP
ncbi:MAG: hypothetical protein KDD91_22985, partial [Caldilinea sp.]|nr:hypothetical protein [Caldilinea sp.]